MVADHLFKLMVESPDVSLNDVFLDEHLLAISTGPTLWFANIINYLALGILPHDLSSHQKKKVFHKVKYYFWEEPFLYKLCKHGIYKHYLPEKEIQSVSFYYHDYPYEGHVSTSKTMRACLSGFLLALIVQGHSRVCLLM